ncbi:penicillin-binding protein 2 [Candidatus Falkowbacteria bacterium]|nr:penicillin-binding protein 2 [Candidatus Falkowbacteria bacterium]
MVSERKKFKLDRISALAIVIFILGCFLVLQLFNIQVVRGEVYTALASGQHKIYQNLNPTRGQIFIKRNDYNINNNLYPIATNEKRHEIYAIPEKITNPVKLSREVAQILNLNEEELKAKFIKEDDPYEPVLKYATDEQVAQVKALESPGLGFVPQDFRLYPEANIYGHLTGFLGFDENRRVGQYGLEGAAEEILAGQEGKLSLETDTLGNWIPTSKKDIVKEAIPGSHLVLTIDNAIQFNACFALKEGVEKYGADSGSIAIMDPKTGAILALCGYPDFDPNNYSKVEDINVYKNQVVAESYEPGSIFKPITMAAALDSLSVTPETTYDDTGEVKIDVYTLRNSDQKAHGIRNMIQVLEESLNTGAIFAMRQAGQEVFTDYVKKFNFGKPTGISLSPESPGDISSLDKRGEIYAATASYGHGITATPLQMLTAYTAIANGGILVKPYIIAETINPDGSKTKTEPKSLGRVLSAKTASNLSAILVSVIRNGHAGKAGVTGYYVGGKTGTALVPKKDARGYSDLTIHSFVGFAPVDNPRFLAIVKLDHVKNVSYAADSTGPIFGKIAKFILNYYEIPPDEG